MEVAKLSKPKDFVLCAYKNAETLGKVLEVVLNTGEIRACEVVPDRYAMNDVVHVFIEGHYMGCWRIFEKT